MQISTVRVVHPNDPSVFMTINSDQLTDEHTLWPEQADADVDKSAAVVVGMPTLTLVETLRLMRFVGKVLARRAGITPLEWAALPPEEQGRQMAAAETELDVGGDEPAEAGLKPTGSMTYGVEKGANMFPSASDTSDEQSRVAKGPRGLWFVMCGDERVSKGFATEDEAKASLNQSEPA